MCAKLKLYAQVCAHQLGKTETYIWNCYMYANFEKLTL